MEPNTKLVVITLVLALTFTAASGQPGLCGMYLNGLNACKRYVETTNPSLIATDLKSPCCAALSKANLQCLCTQKTKIPFSVGSTLTSLLNSRTSVVYLRKLAKRGFLLEGCALIFFMSPLFLCWFLLLFCVDMMLLP
ncbi:hypothetical protein DY000_02042431 [Brassica cretica]|uniref:Bifunctional inhibitor/plant lipid transfer protein/seed storage helical domain-containing protein n=1 Tax=Brassica cretica TaxID=69181 RepID=A0ABQ7BRZ9_BRACR|nr:hypothetical protein DY000_02042431 [Brassica cretica]